MKLDRLLEAPGIWRGRGTPAVGHPEALTTGHPELDRRLPEGGWPHGALVEILRPLSGSGELHLVLPALRQLARARHRIACVNPPESPYPPGWWQRGMPLDRLLFVEAPPDDMLWAGEQLLRSGACGAVLLWPARIDGRRLRRLQLAAERGRCRGFLFRGDDAVRSPSPAALRLALDATGHATVLKCRGAFVEARIPIQH